MTKAFRAALLAALLAEPALAQPYGGSTCTPPDEITIRDDGIGRAIVTYSNSVNQCSVPLIKRLVSPQGIAVDVRIDLLGDDHERRERITLTPVDADMMAFPPEGDLLDGESREFVIMGGWHETRFRQGGRETEGRARPPRESAGLARAAIGPAGRLP